MKKRLNGSKGVTTAHQRFQPTAFKRQATTIIKMMPNKQKPARKAS